MRLVNNSGNSYLVDKWLVSSGFFFFFSAQLHAIVLGRLSCKSNSDVFTSFSEVNLEAHKHGNHA